MATDIKITCDADRILSGLERISHRVDLSLKLRERVRDVLNSDAKLFAIHVDNSATFRTGEIRVRLEPSDPLLEIMAALTGDGQDFAIEVH